MASKPPLLRLGMPRRTLDNYTPLTPTTPPLQPSAPIQEVNLDIISASSNLATPISPPSDISRHFEAYSLLNEAPEMIELSMSPYTPQWKAVPTQDTSIDLPSPKCDRELRAIILQASNFPLLLTYANLITDTSYNVGFGGGINVCRMVIG
jgi:hypothetical protein